MERAKLRLAEDHRMKVLRGRVGAWQEAEAIRSYCDAVEGRHGADAIGRPRGNRMARPRRNYADKAQQLPRLPADPEVTPEGLKPYLGGLSRYGPSGW